MAHRFLEYQPWKGRHRAPHQRFAYRYGGPARHMPTPSTSCRTAAASSSSRRKRCTPAGGRENAKDNDIPVNVTKRRSLPICERRAPTTRPVSCRRWYSASKKPSNTSRRTNMWRLPPTTSRIRKIILDETERKRANRDLTTFRPRRIRKHRQRDRPRHIYRRGPVS